MIEPKSFDLCLYRLQRAKDNLACARTELGAGFWGRSASTFYYAMFSAARAILALFKLDSAKHSGVVSLFHREIIKPGLVRKELGAALEKARTVRTDADYEDFVSIDEATARGQFGKAEHFVAEIEHACRRLAEHDGVAATDQGLP